MGTAPRHPTIHATCLVIDDKGVIVRGRSGAGKTSLALALIAEATRAGRRALLVADDRVHVQAEGGDLLAIVPPSIAGLVERRGSGIYPIDHASEAVIRLVVDLTEAGAAMGESRAILDGIDLPRIDVGRSVTPDTARVMAALALV